MKHDNPLPIPEVAHPSGSSQSSPQDPSSLSTPQGTTTSDPDPDMVIPEQDLASIKARVKEYIHRHTHQFHDVYHSSTLSSQSGEGRGELHQTVQMLKRAQRINSDLWFVQRSLTDKKGITRTQLNTQLLPKLEECRKELDALALNGLKRQITGSRGSKRERGEVDREVTKSKREATSKREASPTKQKQQQAWNKAKSLASRLMRSLFSV
ncbi:hypothetical protein QBC32DRAFT_255998 [Pseudoneurospora amorphoporcata]|uniref:Uncharacterized protein n=1 Tax=Pseudoneurospora amorphoporcata TaxID=241081 RepID=A0AAN6NZY0_9PEZI|nr:hypothetical protein QBC32DRAFT_255998 [Pseudoneurospora amorphoporcata]